MLTTPALDDAAAASTPPRIATLGGLALLFAGLMVAAAGAQLWVFVSFHSPLLIPVPYLLMATGGMAMVLGGFTTKARFWAALAGTVVGLCMAAGILMWTLYSVLGGLLSGVAVLASAVAVTSAVLMPLALWPVLRVDRARRALYAGVA